MRTITNALPNEIRKSDVGLEAQTTYTVSGKQFVVTPVFCQNKKETLGEILLALMKSDIDKS